MQYQDIKSNYSDSILMFQMGDFYEMFFEDAQVASKILDIALTSRNRNSKHKTPMCGVPLNSLSASVKKLLASNRKVAVCDQVEKPSEAGGVVKREVTKHLTPGMVFDPETLESSKPNFIVCFDFKTVSFVDLSTGDNFFYEVKNKEKTLNLIKALKPAEIVIGAKQKNEIKKFKDVLISNYENYLGLSLDQKLFKFDGVEVETTKRLIGYIESMKHSVSLLKPLARRDQDVMYLHENLAEHLEIFETYKGQTKGTLFHTINKTRTAGGARKLREFLQFPLVNKDLILKRQNKICE